MNHPSNLSHVTTQPYLTTTSSQGNEEDLLNSPSTPNLETPLRTTTKEQYKNSTTKLSTILSPYWSSAIRYSKVIHFSTVDKSTTASTSTVSASIKATVDGETRLSAFESESTFKMTSTTGKPTFRVNSKNSSLSKKMKKLGTVRLGGKPIQSRSNMTGQSLPLTFNGIADLDNPKILCTELNPSKLTYKDKNGLYMYS